MVDDHQVVGSESIDVTDEDGEVVARFSFHVEEVGDVRTMLVKAAEFDNGRTPTVDHHWMRMVLKAQADMVSKGLHVQDHNFPDLLGDVNKFHAKFGLEYTGKPRMLPDDLFDFRVKFHEEETSEYRDEQLELKDAVDRKDRRDIISSLEKQLDGLCDSVWVLLGTADLQFGRAAFFEAWNRVAKANMAKIKKMIDQQQEHEESGRAPKFDVVKPAGWIAPDHRDLVQDNAIFDQIFGVIREDPVDPSVECVPTVQEPGYSDTRSI